MIHEKSDFIAFSSDSQRVILNLEQIYATWLDTRRELETLPVSMYWSSKDQTDYLHVKQNSTDNGTSLGPRSAALEQRFAEFIETKEALKTRLASDRNALGARR